MNLIINRNTDPAYNLALEEYVLTRTGLDAVMLWRNDKAVIIGCNQNAVEEIDTEYVKTAGITVIRRQSGGGAVFHDLGNINFTIIGEYNENSFNDYAGFTAPVCGFLKSLGVDAKLEGRNDLVIDGMKFSGNAQAVRKNRIMHHGTILYNADFSDLTKALKPREAKIASKGVKSVRARVTNVSEHLPSPMPVEEFFDRLAAYFEENMEGVKRYELTEEDVAAVNKLVDEKYSKWEWNFGASPDYTYEKSVRLASGIIDLRLKTRLGMIEEAYIFGDFFGILDKSELENALKGVRHDHPEVEKAIVGFDLQKYIYGMSKEDFLDLF